MSLMISRGQMCEKRGHKDKHKKDILRHKREMEVEDAVGAGVVMT